MSSSLSPVGALALIGFGALEGLAFYRAGIYNPEAVHSQMQFRTMSMMKLFVAAVGASMVGQAVLNVFRPSAFEATRVPKTIGWARAVGGSLLVGAGMSLCGFGPTLFPGALVSVHGAHFAVLGGLVGGVAYGLLEKIGVLAVPVSCDAATASSTLLDRASGAPYTVLASAAGATMIAASFALEQLWPHASDMARLGAPFAAPMLPTLAGILIGANQVPLRLIGGEHAGGSTSVMSMLATATGGFIAERQRIPSLLSSKAVQFLYVYVGTALGVWATMRFAPEAPAVATQQAYEPLRSFIGGLVLIAGARIADGCTCGHGISGFSELNKFSIAAAAAIFGGGMLTALCI
jgi:uncharacterized membrane protein YedE/YeeE